MKINLGTWFLSSLASGPRKILVLGGAMFRKNQTIDHIRESLAPDSSCIAKPATSSLDDFRLWVSPEAFGCCRKFTNRVLRLLVQRAREEIQKREEDIQNRELGFLNDRDDLQRQLCNYVYWRLSIQSHVVG
ncbi:hypothetical protein I3842_10G029400 [Carya illinoinensis]|uniref:Uncharacterized protein n=1 Tax=Carya illinoinensis TaxID=32201 RepID=A0A922DTW4_CARIL|nr:hypothetical protein I3842_10G029400 [Carya illinoinensis]KAG6690763.1 hypothetical protein I3842_10G029400 [Carya illinoinensis]